MFTATTDSDPPMGKVRAAAWTCVLAFAKWGAGEMEWAIISGIHSAAGAWCGGSIRGVVQEGPGSWLQEEQVREHSPWSRQAADAHT